MRSFPLTTGVPYLTKVRARQTSRRWRRCFAKSESITISDTIELGLLRVREEKRNRDKREAFRLASS